MAKGAPLIPEAAVRVDGDVRTRRSRIPSRAMGTGDEPEGEGPDKSEQKSDAADPHHTGYFAESQPCEETRDRAAEHNSGRQIRTQAPLAEGDKNEMGGNAEYERHCDSDLRGNLSD